MCRMELSVVVSDLFAENTYVANVSGNRKCIVVDPGLSPEKIERVLEEKSLTPAAILNTHGHSDHIAGNEAIKRRWPDCPLIIGAEEAEKLTDAVKNLSAPFGMPMVSIPADRTVEDGEVLHIAGMDLTVRHTPGHSAGHVVFVYEGQSPAVVFVGDVIFQGSIGRTDFPDGDFAALAASIRDKLFTLPDDTILLPGHGPENHRGV